MNSGFVQFYFVPAHTNWDTPDIPAFAYWLCCHACLAVAPLFSLFISRYILASCLTLPCHHIPRRQKKKAKISEVLPPKQGKMDASPKKCVKCSLLWFLTSSSLKFLKILVLLTGAEELPPANQKLQSQNLVGNPEIVATLMQNPRKTTQRALGNLRMKTVLIARIKSLKVVVN